MNYFLYLFLSLYLHNNHFTTVLLRFYYYAFFCVILPKFNRPGSQLFEKQLNDMLQNHPIYTEAPFLFWYGTWGRVDSKGKIS